MKSFFVNKSYIKIIILFSFTLGEHMVGDSSKVLKFLNLSDELILTTESNQLQKDVLKKLEEINFVGIVIKLPQRIDIERYSAFPVLKVTGFDQRRVATYNLQRNLIAITSTKEGKTIVGPAFYFIKPIDYSKLVMPDPKDISSDVEIISISCRLFNLRESLGIPWEPEVYRTTFIYYDWKSNTVTTELVSKEKKREAVSLSSPMTIEAEVPLKFCSKNIEPVLKFSVPDKVSLREKEILMKVEIRVPVGEYCRKVEAGRLIGWKNFCLLFVRKNQDQRPVLRYDFSVMGRKELEKGDEITSDLVLEGKFVIDLRKRVPDFFYDEIEYCCYLVSYEVIEGPSVITVVR